MADQVVVPKRNAIPRPEGLTAAQGAVLGTAWLTAYRMLFTKSGLRPGQTMLVQGASGGVSTALVQLGRAAGMRVWVTGRDEEKRALAEKLGAHATFESGERSCRRRSTRVFESVGEATWSHSMRALKPGGIIVICGSTSGPNPPRRPAAAVLPPVARRRLDHGDPRRAGQPHVVRRDDGHLAGDRAGGPDGPGAGRVRAMLEGKTAGKIVLTR